MKGLQLNLVGLFLAVLNSLTDSTYLALANVLPVTPVFVLLARSAAHILLSSIVLSLFWRRDIAEVAWSKRKLLTYRACINGITITLKAICVQYMSVADMSVISQTTPVFVCIIAVIFLKEKLTLVDAAIITLCFLGVFLVLQPDTSMIRTRPAYLIAAACMLAGSFVNATTTVMLKQLASANVHFAVIMCSSGWSTLAYGSVGFLVLYKSGQVHSTDLCINTVHTSALVLVAGCLGYSAQFTNIQVLKHIRASVKSVLCNTLNVFLGFLYTVLLTPQEESLNKWKIFGAILVLCSGFLLYAKKEGKLTNIIGRKRNEDAIISRKHSEIGDDDETKLLRDGPSDSDA
ncbi:solute carrier family 35 member G1-like [Convolutriloba macropyga]|uniref:solute carrier family 35 member G1-like n=1 Tax=Convolutriloba macropyga TaxID=536237 RepID=UPI003F51BE12